VRPKIIHAGEFLFFGAALRTGAFLIAGSSSGSGCAGRLRLSTIRFFMTVAAATVRPE
jgi:hypothetical protein